MYLPCLCYSMYDMKYIAYDFETTGLDYAKDQPVEIGAITVDDQTGETAQYDIFIKIPAPLSEDTKRITGITDEMLAEKGVALEGAMKALFKIMGLRPDGFDAAVTIIGHNIIGFDNLFLKKYAENYGYAFPERERFFDTAGEFRGLLLGEARFAVAALETDRVKFMNYIGHCQKLRHGAEGFHLLQRCHGDGRYDGGVGGGRVSM